MSRITLSSPRRRRTEGSQTWNVWYRFYKVLSALETREE